MPAYSRSARETLRLPGGTDGPFVAPWAVFDPDWYRARYVDAPEGTAEELLEWHLTWGQLQGHSPNRYFDEMWQRRAWPGILALIEAGSVASAFDAWCRGPHATRAPHWLFEPREYRTRYPALTDDVLAETGFINRYHHYLRFGAAEGRIGHALFDPAVYLAGLAEADAADAAPMPFEHYLRGLENGAPERRTSLLFDPDWYRERYPAAAQAVLLGRYRSLLEHYLCNDRPTEFDPSPWFSEQYYLAENPGLSSAIGPAGFRNGYAHFLAFGLHEGRSPGPNLDIAWYAGRDGVRADIAAERAPDAFVHWITVGHEAGLPGRPPARIEVNEAQAIEVFRRRANTIMPLFARHQLDFSHNGHPAISVIMTIGRDPAETMVSLGSLRAHYHGATELILVSCDPAAPGSVSSGAVPGSSDIETLVMGATVLRFGAEPGDTAAREAGFICATAAAVLFLADGVELAPGAIDTSLARLASNPMIGAVGGRMIQPHGTVLEAGGIVWRDGGLLAYGLDAAASAPEVNFVRDTDFCSSRFLLARREVVAALPAQAAGLAGTTHDAADLCARIQEAGFRVVYDPDAVGFVTNRAVERPDGQAAFVGAHGAFLASRPAFDPAASIRARSPYRGQTRILFIEDSIPLRRIGSGFVRSNDVLRAMAASGASVTVFPMKDTPFPLSAVRAEMPDTIEVMHDGNAAGFADFLAARRDCFDLIWIARTHNLDLIHATLDALIGTGTPVVEDALPRSGGPGPAFAADLSLLEQLRGLEDGLWTAQAPVGQDPHRVRIVIDTEAVASVRRAQQAAPRNEDFDLDAALREEFKNLTPAMRVVAVTEAEAALIRTRHRGEVRVLGHSVVVSPTPRRFEDRVGMLFVGAIHAMDQPNYDGLVWFIDEVLPLIEQTLRWETRLTVAGYIAPGVSLERFKFHPRVTLRGAVGDLTPLYDANRVFVAPARFAAGIPYKVHEAAAFGLPVVATSLLARQLGWADGDAIGASESTDPAGFAARVVALHRDAPLWTRIRESALARVAAELDPRVFAKRVADLTRCEPGRGLS
jgi:hypothetical protein